jgi:hypothetical protein
MDEARTRKNQRKKSEEDESETVITVFQQTFPPKNCVFTMKQ